MRDEGKLNIIDTYKPIVCQNLFNGRETLYLCSGNNDVSTLVDYTDLKVTDILEEIISETGIYKHDWEVGDLVIWDNVSTMHRSAGDWEGGTRLLYRVQLR